MTNVGTTGSIPTPATTKSHATRWPLAVSDGLHAPGALKRRDPVIGHQLNAVRLVDRANRRADLAA